MQVYVQKSTSTTLPCKSAGVSGGVFSQPVAPSNPGMRSGRSAARSYLGPLRQNPVGADEVARVAVGIVLEVILMLRFGFPEVTGRRDLRHDLPRPAPGGVDVGDRLLGDLPLLVVDIEDRGPVARADVVPLAVHRRRVVDPEEELEQRAIRRSLGIERDLDGLGMRAV